MKKFLAIVISAVFLVSLGLAPATAASGPSGLTVTDITNTTALAKWNAVTGAVQYQVTANGVYVGSSTTNQRTLTGLTPCTDYAIQVKVKTTYWSPLSAPVNVKTQGCASPQPLGVAGTWTLDFQDEFNGTTLDSTRWNSNWWGEGPTSSSNVSVSNGELRLKVSDLNTGANVNSNNWDKANPGYEFTTGYVEARIFIPGDSTTNGCYNWPAFWINGHNWPTDGENDIAEVLGGEMTVNYHSDSGAHNQGAVPGVWCGAYHTYGAHRKADSVDVYYDGTLVKSYPTDDANAPQYILFTTGPIRPEETVVGDASIVKVDYVRVWK